VILAELPFSLKMIVLSCKKLSMMSRAEADSHAEAFAFFLKMAIQLAMRSGFPSQAKVPEKRPIHPTANSPHPGVVIYVVAVLGEG
jgi:hypothetical protein